MSKHQNISSPFAVHPFAYTSNADPASDASIDMAPYKGWINTGNSNLLKVRNAANGAWEDVSVAGAATASAFGSNSASVTTYNDNAGTLGAANAHHHIGVTSLAHTSNTFTGPITLTASGTLGITSPSTGVFNLSAVGGSSSGGSTSLTNNQGFLGADVTMTTANTFYDGPTYAPVSGTWLLIATALIANNSGGGQRETFKIWDGTTVYASGQITSTGAGAYVTCNLSVIVTASGSQTFKMSVTGNGGTQIMMRHPDTNGTGTTGTGTTLIAIKIA